MISEIAHLVIDSAVAIHLHIVPLVPCLDDLLSLFRLFQVAPCDAVYMTVKWSHSFSFLQHRALPST